MGVDRRGFLARAGLTVAAAQLASRVTATTSAATPEVALTGESVDWGWVRQQFELAPDWIHLATFFLASHPRPVREAIEAYRRLLDENPLFVEEAMFEPRHENVPLRVKTAVARYVGGQPDEVALVPNTTTGLALVYNGLRVKPGQEILTTEHDHYSHHTSIAYAAEKSGATVRRVALHDGAAGASEAEIVDRLRRAVAPRTRAVGVTWVHSSTGLCLPIRAMADVVRAANAGRDDTDRCLLVVDGAHGLGALDESVAALGADFFVAGLHKWMLAPRGTGIIWARDTAWPHVRPTVPSFDSFDPFNAWATNEPLPPKTQAAWVAPGGFYAFEHLWGAEAAIQFHERLGRSRVAGRVRELNGTFRRELGGMKHVRLHTPASDALSAGIVCFEVAGMKPEEVVRRLHAKKIHATTSPYAVSYARVSAGIMVSPQEVERTVREIRALSA
jgi:selenocysteine lyase/cysteine desulfurase